MSRFSPRRAIPSVVRVLISTILLSGLFAACLYLYHTAFPFFEAHLLETGKKSTAWFAEQLSYSLPFILIGLYFTIAYHSLDKRDGVASREKFWIAVLVTLVTYGILLPYVNHLSGELYAAAVEAGAKIPETDGGVPMTLMMDVLEWFLRLSIPMGLVMVFYGMRAARERQCPDEPERTPLTASESNTPHTSADSTQEEVSHVES